MTPSITQFKRVMLLVIIVLALLSTITGWIVMAAHGVLTPTLGWVQCITTLVLSMLLVAAWWRLLPQRAIELGCLLFAALMCAACMVLGMYWPQDGAGIQLQPLYLWIPVVYVFAFTLTDHRTGLFVSLAIFLVFVGISVPYILQGRQAGLNNLTWQLHFVSAVLIAALYYFSSYQYRLGSVQRAADQLTQLSNTDELTQLSNRRHLSSLIEEELTRGAARRHALAVVLFDVDHFKAVNDEFGHSAGDGALTTLATCAARVFRNADSLGRWGGDEFVALVRDVNDAEARQLAETLRQAIAAEPLPNGRRMTVSCGVAAARTGDNIDSLLQRADAALYAAKRAGRNQISAFT